jgi:serine/threonine protein kinase
MSKVCPECGIKYRDKDVFCPKCRSNLIVLKDKDPLIGTVIDNRFTITEKIGTGGMGSVYKAVQHSLNKEVALKIIRGDLSENLPSIKRFLREAKASSRLDHPNTIKILDFGQTATGLLFIAMEYLKGQTLTSLLHKERRIPLERSVKIIFQICDSLGEAHHFGIIHRDLKPDNIMILDTYSNPEFVKVLDFGIAKIVTGDVSDSLTKTGQIFGTPQYMSPEQAKAQELDARSDIYSLGVMFFEMLAGTKPFSDPAIGDLILKIINTAPPLLSDVCPDLGIPAEVELLINSLLSKKREKRPGNVMILKNTLKKALESSGKPVSDSQVIKKVKIKTDKQENKDEKIITEESKTDKDKQYEVKGEPDSIIESGPIVKLNTLQETQVLDMDEGSLPDTLKVKRSDEKIIKPKEPRKPAIIKPEIPGPEIAKSDDVTPVRLEDLKPLIMKHAAAKQTAAKEESDTSRGDLFAEVKSKKRLFAYGIPAFIIGVFSIAFIVNYLFSTNGDVPGKTKDSYIEEDLSAVVPDVPQIIPEAVLKTEIPEKPKEEAIRIQKETDVVPKIPEKKEQVTIEVHSRPEGAFLFENNKRLGQTPYNITREKGYSAEIVLKLEKYRDKTDKLTWDMNAKHSVILEKAKVKPSPKPVPKPKTKGDPFDIPI